MEQFESETMEQGSDEAPADQMLLPSEEIECVDKFFKSPDFYENAQKYWSNVSPTIDGMLGGLSVVSPTDIQSSSQFLGEIFKMKPTPNKNRALDCGAGIGRVTKHLLGKFFTQVDLVEQDANFVQKANEYLYLNGVRLPFVGTLYNEGLQNFTPEPAKYDIIWCQWVLGHLTDADLLAFFRRCIDGLAANGCIIVKENATATDDFAIDAVDSSVTRSLKITKTLLEAAGLRVFKLIKQKDFIQGLFPVYMIACRPIKK